MAKTKKKKNDGKFLEYVIQLIEKSLSPDSVVERNIWLPVLASKTGETVQCDVVIRKSNPHGTTLWIVEVQDRTGQVKPNDFRGWLDKTKDVGAQHLICVSRREFPKSIKEKAELSGNTTSLIVLKQSTADQIPIDFIHYTFTHRNFDISNYHNYQMAYDSSIPIASRPKGAVQSNERKFSLDKVTMHSIFTLCREACIPLYNNKSGRNILKFSETIEPFLYFQIDKEFLKVNLEVDFEWTFEMFDVPVSTLSYEQNNQGSLAWVLEVNYNTTKGPINLKIPIVKEGQKYKLLSILGTMPPEHELQMDIHPPIIK